MGFTLSLGFFNLLSLHFELEYQRAFAYTPFHILQFGRKIEPIIILKI